MPFISLDNLQRFHANLLNLLLGKQDTLVSGENISTINGISLLDGGDISVTAEGGVMYVLFESSTVDYNNITLSDSVVNYDAIEVFGETNEGHLLYTKLFNPNGKKFILCSVPVITGTYASGFSFVFKEYSVSGTTLTGNSGASGETSVTQNGKHNHTSSTTTVGITRVIGYKNI